eukprot:CAMPEP_0204216138 /NCGR_PEP_ID=MMETSP0361-20130328/77943_1 /ASSEMBLY_ACC=CAM_ASM_000343 /TAXON_ID=268821 /ORGANISM="Scrippsiella Hangoei, Strain SHTV-5" /LENGTH=69 /DNA_ID=CAMNT_0051180959 /DNA_START=61 /DNA_END=266 /DNA_ORIENTATION=+
MHLCVCRRVSDHSRRASSTLASKAFKPSSASHWHFAISEAEMTQEEGCASEGTGAGGLVAGPGSSARPS